ncbi:MAG: response regulator transcription factor [Chloroflexota bacterium]
MAERVRVLLVDDQSLLRAGLRTLLDLRADIQVVGEAGDGLEAEEQTERLHPHVVVMDLRMPRRGGIEATRRIRERWPSIHVLVLTTFDEDDLVFDAIAAGAAGYVLKDINSETLAEAVLASARGDAPLNPGVARKLVHRLRRQPALPLSSQTPPADRLTDREQTILELLASGSSNREIADKLALTEGTVKNYVSSILSKIGVRDRTQAALYAVRAGLKPS